MKLRIEKPKFNKVFFLQLAVLAICSFIFSLELIVGRETGWWVFFMWVGALHSAITMGFVDRKTDETLKFLKKEQALSGRLLEAAFKYAEAVAEVDIESWRHKSKKLQHAKEQLDAAMDENISSAKAWLKL